MGKHLLRYISAFGIGLYLVALITISLVFKSHALPTKWIIWGISEVLFFFVLTSVFYPRWKSDDSVLFWRKVFWVALAVRVAYVIFSYYYYCFHTGFPFEKPGDEVGYYYRSVYLAKYLREGNLKFVRDFLNQYTMGFSDRGYLVWLTLIHTLFGPNLLLDRFLKALISAYLCIVVYKLSSRTFGERTGRLAAVMCVFMPILIQLTGTHIKEMEMIFLSILALERMDYLIRSKKYTFWNVLFPILLTGLTFGFRTVVGMCLIFAFFVFIILSPKDLVSRKGKIITLLTTGVILLVFLFSAIGNEMKIYYMLNFSGSDYLSKKYESMGMEYHELAQSKYLYPGAFVLPLSPMVKEAPKHNKRWNGSMYVKNFLGFFAMLSIVVAFRQKKWRDFSLIGAYELAYLGIVMSSFTANSERYHEPAIPLLLVMAAYAMTHLRRKDMIWFYAYCGVLLVALFAWNWLKLASRGLV